MEIKYEVGENGYCFTSCPNKNYVKVGSVECGRCKNCVKRNTETKTVTCSHPGGEKSSIGNPDPNCSDCRGSGGVQVGEHEYDTCPCCFNIDQR